MLREVERRSHKKTQYLKEFVLITDLTYKSPLEIYPDQKGTTEKPHWSTTLNICYHMLSDSNFIDFISNMKISVPKQSI